MCYGLYVFISTNCHHSYISGIENVGVMVSTYFLCRGSTNLNLSWETGYCQAFCAFPITLWDNDEIVLKKAMTM
jgi:hypothetical protein